MEFDLSKYTRKLTQPLTARISVENYAKLQSIAEQNNLKLASLVQGIVKDFIDYYEQNNSK